MRARTALLLGLTLVAAGVMFGLSVLYPAGFALLALPLGAAIWVRLAAIGIVALRYVPPGPFVEGEEYPLEVELVSGLVPAPGVEVRDPLLSRPLRLGPGSKGGRTSFAFERRGRRDLGPVEIAVRDPFGLAERRVQGEDAGELIVLPRTEPLQVSAGAAGGRSLGFGERGGGGGGPDSWSAEFEIDGLRPYREGSPAARIHWPTVARTGELHERRITAGADAARLVIVDPQGAVSVEQLDSAVRAAASICLELAAGRGCALLLSGEPRTLEVEGRLRNWRAIHSRLALVEADRGAPAVHRIGRAGVVFWVTADPGRRPEQGLRRISAARRILVAPEGSAFGSAASHGSLFTVAGCEGREVGARTGRAATAGGVA